MKAWYFLCGDLRGISAKNVAVINYSLFFISFVDPTHIYM